MTSNTISGASTAHVHGGTKVRVRTHDSIEPIVETLTEFHSDLEDTGNPLSNREQLSGETPERRFGRV